MFETTNAILTIAEAARLIESKQLSPVDLVQSLLDRIAALNPQIDAFVTLDAEGALASARKAETEITGGRYRGPMHGIPFGAKDIFNTAGILTSGHSRICADHVPEEDAAVVARLYEAGAILMGKLSSHEFAHGGPSFDLPWPPARNPWDPRCQPGGSSSGSGAAIAAGFVLGALGSDTGGSIRNPASLCGVVGLKPTYGLLSRRGMMTNSYSLDHAGMLAWTVEDAALMLQATAGPDPKDPASADRPVPNYRAALSQDIRGRRIGIVRHFWEEDHPANPEVRQAMEDAMATFHGLGAVVEDVRMAPLQDYYAVKNAIAESELLAVHAHDLRTRPAGFGVDFQGRVMPACLFTGDDYVQAQRERRRMMEAMRPLYARFDALVTAGTYGPAPLIDAHRTLSNWKAPSISTPFNVTAGPAIAVCAGFSRSGMPLGLQVTGRPFDETTMLRIAYAYEKATPWRGRRPQLVPGRAPAANRISNHACWPDADPDPETRNWVEGAVSASGWHLTDLQLQQVLAAAPYIREMKHRLRRQSHWSEEPAGILPSAG